MLQKNKNLNIYIAFNVTYKAYKITFPYRDTSNYINVAK